MLAEGFMISVSVNVSAKQLDRDRIIDDVQNALSSSGFPAGMLTLELTETTLMVDVDETLERLKALKALGVHLAIDDFGTGYSSMAYVRQFPIDVLKIDQSFVAGLGETAEAGALVHSLVELGKALGIRTIAEGVETEAQRQTLLAENTDEAQGFYFARPLDFSSVIQLLRSQDIGVEQRLLAR
jgi:EAL domain-containing protein (putative c-di-GMP-specific phosphodiesterase class I)